MRYLTLTAALTALTLTACEPEKVEPALVITPNPRTIDGEGQVSTVKLQAFDDEDKAGTGTVRLSSTAGTWAGEVEVTLSNGQAEMEFGCNRADGW